MMASTASSSYVQTILEDCESLPPPPPSWVRIGIFGSPCSGKHRLMAAFSTHPTADTAAASGEHHGESSPAEHATYSTTGTEASKSPRGAHCSERDEAHLLPFLKDACATLFECGAYDTPHSLTPTRVHFRIAATEPDGGSLTDDAAGRRTETSVVDVELVNCWSFTCRGELPKSEEHQRVAPVHDEGVVLSCPELPVVVFRDEDIVSCDAFLIVVDVTSKTSYDVCADLLSHLRSVAASSLALGGDMASAPVRQSGNLVSVASAFLSEPVIVVVASTHGIEEGRARCVTSDECKTLGSVWRTPIFEVALLPTEVPKLRRVLEKVIMRVLKHQR